MAKSAADPLGDPLHVLPKGGMLGNINSAATNWINSVGGVFKDAWDTPGPVGKVLSVMVGALAGAAISGAGSSAASSGTAGGDAGAAGGASGDIVPVEAGAGTGSEAAANLGTVDASGGVAGGVGSETVANSGPTTTNLAANAAPTDTTTNLATNTADTGVASTPNAALQSGQYVDPGTGSVVTPGPGTGADVAPSNPGLIQGAMDWAKANPQLASTGTAVLGNTIAGAAGAAKQQKANQEAAKTKLANEEALQQFQREQIQAGSAGGGGVNLNMRPGQKVLRRPDGTLVYAPNGGLIGNAFNKG